MSLTLAFDVYGTLIDPHGIVIELEKVIGDKAIEFSNTWRTKQLEYAFRRGLMQNYEDFSVCTRDALIYTNALFNTQLSTDQLTALLEQYQRLPAFDDVLPALQQLQSSGFDLFAFSNGSQESVGQLLNSANIAQFFNGVVSVEETKSFKPDPAVYNRFLVCTKAQHKNAWLISSNPFDVIGAISSGMKAAWVKRSEQQVFDPWGIEPTVTVSSLTELIDHFN